MAMNLLDLMRSDEGTFAPRLAPVGATALVVDVVEQMTPVAIARGNDLAIIDHVGSTTIVCDAEMVRRLLQNLIDNALRHSPRGGRVTLEARMCAGYIELRVSDEGPGIPVELRDAVFERGRQLEAGLRSGGRGLGLAFCRLATIGHGGSIGVDSNEPRGSIFIVQLPLAGPEAVAGTAQTANGAAERERVDLRLPPDAADRRARDRPPLRH